MNVEKAENNDKISLLLTGLVWASGGLAVFLFMVNSFGYGIWIAASIACIIGFLLKPLMVTIRESRDRLISFREKMLLGLKVFLVFSWIQSTYLVFVSPLYDLYWSYWVLLGSFLLLAGIAGRENRKNQKDLKEEEKEEKKGFKELKKVGAILLSATLTTINFYQLYVPYKAITLQDLVIPDSISIQKIDETDAGYWGDFSLYLQRETILVNEEETLHKLIKSLEGTEVQNLRHIGDLNYLKMQRVENFHYSGYVDYEGVNVYREISSDTTKYIYGIEIYPNGRVYLLLITEGRRRIQNFSVDLEYKMIEELLKGEMTLQ
ncbi:hypothetical protein CACET_c24230 [Clostridium aceticum]|uniref:Uncharacterized protein n=1 Tax=Clostridium aceticum TaxID=84022 RepID=A0A0D8I944_9CLOT|nr:hypothetical protein [Clostridium aceticum]AKL95868.1 hypothetical protein CACET_c24230 [Clostridium aceticum]KJF26542.1 hypothetical protein TZ02_12750 [Clostridium aceticum]